MSSSVVLLSGGLDSAVNLAEAVKRTTVKLAVTFDYGQESSIREITAAAAMCARLNVEHIIIELPWLGLSDSSLTGTGVIPDAAPGELDNPEASQIRADAVWVPNRNGTFLNIAAGLAEKVDANFVIPGFNAEEAETFPDNSAEFINAENAALRYSTRGRVAVKCYTSAYRKNAVAAMGIKNGAALDLVWSCYRGGEAMCGRCESCQRLRRAYSEAGLSGLLEGRMSP